MPLSPSAHKHQPYRQHFWHPWKLSALALAAVLSACGGDDDTNDVNPLGITRIQVFGDSLSDNGTFADAPGGARIATVQGTRNEPTVLWVEHITRAYTLAPLCPVYKFNGSSFNPNSRPGCTNYAVGGGRINNPASSGGAAAPLSIIKQLQDGAAAGWGDRDLLVIDGGGNDAADLVGAYLGGGAINDTRTDYGALLATLLSAQDYQAIQASNPDSPREAAGALYMRRLADSFSDAIHTLALNQGVRHVVVANIPTITYTPRFQFVLDRIAASQGGGAAGETARTRAEGLFKSWIDTFNQRLAARFSGDARVKVVDIATRFTDQMRNPARYGLSNVTLPVCGAEWVTAVPTRSFAQCTASALSATTPPPGAPAGSSWWERHMFADGFHPTPYGHALMADQVIGVLDEADWL